MAQSKPFKFTQQQRTDLLSSWARQSAKDKAWYFIDHVEKIIVSQIVNALPDEKSPHEERADRKKILDQAKKFRGALLNQSIRSGHMLERFLETEHQLPESDDDSTHREHLIAYLKTVEFAMTILTSGDLPSEDTKGEYRRRRIMRGLVHSYRIHFGDYPSSTHRGNFMRFLSTLAKIIDMPLGKDLADRAIEDVKKQFQTAEKIKRELGNIFLGIIPDLE